jgi:polysaccharide deacetylase 2 family uncharacterized protein YibQ
LRREEHFLHYSLIASLVVSIIFIIFIAVDIFDSFQQDESDVDLADIHIEKVLHSGGVISEVKYDSFDEYPLLEEEHKEELNVTAQNEIDDENLTVATLDENITEEEPKNTLPKLVIIVDDMSFKSQLREIEKLDMVLNLSFLPPTKVHPNSGTLAHTQPNYMVHLPLEALSYANQEDNTIEVGFSEERIEEIVSSIREKFPVAKFVNNHTGSKFTADRDAMRKLIKVLDRYDFQFVDSRTTPNTEVKAVMREFNYDYIRRNIFLDNISDVEYIKNQINKAINMAKKRGFAIAICHPKRATFSALRESKEKILENVELIYINELYI